MGHKSMSFARLADGLRREKKIDEAIALCKQGIAQFPHYLSGYLILAKCLIETDKPDEAKLQLESALKIDPKCLYALKALGDILVTLQWQNAGADLYAKVLQIDPWDNQVQSLYARYAKVTAATPAAVEFKPIAPLRPPVGGESLPFLTPPPHLEAAANIVDMPLNDDLQMLPEELDGSSLSDALEALPFFQETVTTPAQEITGERKSLTLADEISLPEASEVLEVTDITEVPENIVSVSDTAFAPNPILEMEREEQAFASDENASVSGNDIEEAMDKLFDPKPITTDFTMEQDAFATQAMPIAEEHKPTHEFIEASSVTQTLERTVEFEEEIKKDGSATATMPVTSENPVSGSDVAQRLEDIFTPESDTHADPRSEEMESVTEAMSAISATETQAHILEPEEFTGLTDTDRVLGDDVVAQLDSLFPDDSFPPVAQSIIEPEVEAESITRAVNIDLAEANENLELEQTMMLPISREELPLPEVEIDAPLKSAEPLTQFPSESMQEEDENITAGQATMVLSRAQFEDAPTLPDMPSSVDEGTGVFDLRTQLAASEHTETIPVVDGRDITDRLDELFGAEDTHYQPIEMVVENEAPGLEETSSTIDFNLEPQPIMEIDSKSDIATDFMTPVVSGDDVSARLDQIFQEEPTGMFKVMVDPTADASDLETSDDILHRPLLGGNIMETSAFPLANLQEESNTEEIISATSDDNFEEEETSALGSAPNVATVTLAEIYFQQGLKEQALQIYRQLLELEPDNTSVQKRKLEIEANLAEEAKRSPEESDTDFPRRKPRPGLKVPKRKK